MIHRQCGRCGPIMFPSCQPTLDTWSTYCATSATSAASSGTPIITQDDYDVTWAGSPVIGWPVMMFILLYTMLSNMLPSVKSYVGHHVLVLLKMSSICAMSGRKARAIHLVIICPIAIAYSMGQIIKSVCVCQSVSLSVYLSVCEHSHGRIS